MIDLYDENLPENIVPWGATLYSWAYAEFEKYYSDEEESPWEKHFDVLAKKFNMEQDHTRLIFVLIILFKMYFIEFKIKEEDEDDEEKINIFMQEAERRISNVLFHSRF